MLVFDPFGWAAFGPLKWAVVSTLALAASATMLLRRFYLHPIIAVVGDGWHWAGGVRRGGSVEWVCWSGVREQGVAGVSGGVGRGRGGLGIARAARGGCRGVGGRVCRMSIVRSRRGGSGRGMGGRFFGGGSWLFHRRRCDTTPLPHAAPRAPWSGLRLSVQLVIAGSEDGMWGGLRLVQHIGDVFGGAVGECTGGWVGVGDGPSIGAPTPTVVVAMGAGIGRPIDGSITPCEGHLDR